MATKPMKFSEDRLKAHAVAKVVDDVNEMCQNRIMSPEELKSFNDSLVDLGILAVMIEEESLTWEQVEAWIANNVTILGIQVRGQHRFDDVDKILSYAACTVTEQRNKLHLN